MPPSSRTLPLLFRSLLWRRACRLIAITTINIRVGDAHGATCAFTRTRTRVPLPGCLRSVPLGRITRVDVRVDIGLGIRRRHSDNHGQTAQATDQGELHQLSSFSTNKRHSFYWVASTTIKSKRQTAAAADVPSHARAK